MPTIALTDRKIAGLKPAPERVEYFDRSMPGFGLRVSPDGRKSFVLLYRVARPSPRPGAEPAGHSKRVLKRLTLGIYPDVGLAKARDLARAELQKATTGRDPSAERKQARQQTFGALAERYVERHAKPRKRSWRDDARMIRTALDDWRDRPASAITRSDVRELLEAVVDRGAPVAANRLLALVRKVFNFGLDQEWVEANPAQRVARPADEQSRTRVLSADELRVLWKWLQKRPAKGLDVTERRYWMLNRAALKLRLITAQRGGEVVSMRWSDVDLSAKWWNIPAEHSKNKLPHRVPLTALAIDVLKGLEAEDKQAKARQVQSGQEHGRGKVVENLPQPIQDTARARDAVGKAVGANYVFQGIRGTRQRRGALEGLALEDVRPHDFRRTAASMMAGAGVPRLVIAKVLNHVETGVTAVYDRHGYDAEKRGALDAWDREVLAIVSGKPNKGKVLAHRPRRRS